MQNGYFQLVNAPGGYGLQIFQPKDGGADVNLQEVLNYLERESVPYDPMAIKNQFCRGKIRYAFWRERIARHWKKPTVSRSARIICR